MGIEREVRGRENPKGNKEILEIEGDVVSCLYEHGGLFLSFLHLIHHALVNGL